MLRSVHSLFGFRLAATDGDIGRVKDFLFDEDHWAIRYMVADTGKWLAERKVLISPISLGTPDWESQHLLVKLTTKAIESAPELDEHAPVSRQYERRWFDYYGLSYYWIDTGLYQGFWGGATYPEALIQQHYKNRVSNTPSPEEEDKLLRSVDEISGYDVMAVDDGVGEVEDLIVEEDTWKLRYLVVDTRRWLPGKKVLVSVDWIKDISWPEKRLLVDLTQDEARNSPEFDPTNPVNREFEERLYDYYGRPVYWK